MPNLFWRPRGQDGGARGARGVCIECGQPRRSYYLRCDACAQTIWQRLLQQTPSSALPAVAPASQYDTAASQTSQTAGQQVDRAYLASLPDDAADKTPDDTPFGPSLDTYPTLPALPAALRHGEFTGLMAQVRGALEALPAIREDWNGCCLWCAREMRELSDDRYTHQPRRATLTTCERHRAGLLALSADLRNGGYRTRFPASEGWAQG